VEIGSALTFLRTSVVYASAVCCRACQSGLLRPIILQEEESNNLYRFMFEPASRSHSIEVWSMRTPQHHFFKDSLTVPSCSPCRV
jgi:hypothetical protein